MEWRNSASRLQVMGIIKYIRLEISEQHAVWYHRKLERVMRNEDANKKKRKRRGGEHDSPGSASNAQIPLVKNPSISRLSCSAGHVYARRRGGRAYIPHPCPPRAAGSRISACLCVYRLNRRNARASKSENERAVERPLKSMEAERRRERGSCTCSYSPGSDKGQVVIVEVVEVVVGRSLAGPFEAECCWTARRR